MLNSIEKMSEVIEEIEANLKETISVSALAERAALSTYEFRRIFSFLVGIPLSEYIRKRRLSQAALEFREKNANITDIAAEYGYDSPSSFSRAFREMHGVSPSEALLPGTQLHLLSRAAFTVCAGGGRDISYSLIPLPEQHILGMTARSEISDTCCCESVWNAFYDGGYDGLLRTPGLYKGKQVALYTNGEDEVNCTIGAFTDGKTEIDRLTVVTVPPSVWVCIPVTGTEEETVNAFYDTVLNEWLPSAGYKRNDALPNMEIFPEDAKGDYKWEIRIPVIKR